MRQIKFRGKRVDNGKWVYGFYIELTKSEKGHYICFNENGEWLEVKVFPKTVGQFTGLKDASNCDVYEGQKRQYKGIIYNIVGLDWKFVFGRNMVEHGDNESRDLTEDTAYESVLVND